VEAELWVRPAGTDMNNSTSSSPEHEANEPQTGHDQQHAGNSGEGAASALAQLKTQTRQQKRQAGDEDAASGPGA
jgi:hypothetical protein